MEQMVSAMSSLRERPPTEIAGYEVLEVLDLIDGTDELAASDVLIYSLDEGRVIIRPSGTEPKVKAYIEAIASDHMSATARLTKLEAAAHALL